MKESGFFPPGCLNTGSKVPAVTQQAEGQPQQCQALGAAHSQDPQAGCKIKQKGILILYVNKTMQIGETNKPRNITRWMPFMFVKIFYVYLSNTMEIKLQRLFDLKVHYWSQPAQ